MSEEIIRYPYLGFSNHLINYFCIIGYDKSQLKYEILSKYLANDKNYPDPDVLSAISANNEFELLDTDNLTMFALIKKLGLVVSSSEPVPTSHIFYSNPDTDSEKLKQYKKTPYHGVYLIFYENIKSCLNPDNELDNKILQQFSNKITLSSLYAPKAFCIISHYSYFTFFNFLNKELLKYFRNENLDNITNIPIEILIHNIITFTPAPINYSMNFNVFKNNGYMLVQLTGYPLLEYNVAEIFNIIPIIKLIPILMFFYLEYDMVFFSKNQEILNFVMYTISALLYPQNESQYSWHIVSVSQDDLEKFDSFYIGRTCAYMIGVNCTYDNINTSKISNTHFIVDLDNKQFFLKYLENTDEQKNINSFHDYLKRVLIGDINLAPCNLQKIIRALQKDLERILASNIKNDHDNVNFFEFNENIFSMNKSIQEAFYSFMLSLLKIGYDFYFLNPGNFYSQVEYNNLNLNQNEPQGGLNSISYEEDVKKLTSDELNYYNFYKGTMRFGIFFKNYIHKNSCRPFYRIFLLICEEFIFLQKHILEPGCIIKYLDIIDNIYTPGKTIKISFDDFETYYQNNLKDKICLIINKPNVVSSNNVSPVKGNSVPRFDSLVPSNIVGIVLNNSSSNLSGNPLRKSSIISVSDRSKAITNSLMMKNTGKYNEKNICSFDNEILMKYMHFLNNISNKGKIFPSKIYKKNNEFPKISIQFIIDSMELSLIKQKVIKMEQLIIFSIIIIFIITRENSKSMTKSMTHLKELLEILDMKHCIFRKYINLILQVYEMPTVIKDNKENIDKKEIKEKKDKKVNIFSFEKQDIVEDKENKVNQEIKGIQEIKENKEIKGIQEKENKSNNTNTSDETLMEMCNYIIINSLRQKNILPNEIMNKYFNSFKNYLNRKGSDENVDKNEKEPENEQEISYDINKYKIFLQYHICDCMKFKKPEYFLKLAEDVTYDGDIYIFKCKECGGTEPKTSIQFRFDQTNIIIFSEIFSPLKLFRIAGRLLNVFKTNNKKDFFSLDEDLRNKVIINLVFYSTYLGIPVLGTSIKFLIEFIKVSHLSSILTSNEKSNANNNITNLNNVSLDKSISNDKIDKLNIPPNSNDKKKK